MNAMNDNNDNTCNDIKNEINENSNKTNTEDLFPFQFDEIISNSNVSLHKKVKILTKDEKIENKIIHARKNNKIKNEKRKEKLRESWNMKSIEEQMILRQENKLRLEISKKKLEDALINGLNVCVDLYFDDEHSQFEQKSLAKQLSLGKYLLLLLLLLLLPLLFPLILLLLLLLLFNCILNSIWNIKKSRNKNTFTYNFISR
jgi:hypothetical protein